MTFTNADQPYTDQQPPARSQTRDIAALAMLSVGLVGLAAVAFLWDWHAGAALVSAYLAVAGVVTGIDR